MKILYYDCFCGISGDMNLGAMIDLGVDAAYLAGELSKLGLDSEFEFRIGKGVRSGIAGTKVDIHLTGAEHGHSHAHSHDNGHGRSHTHRHLQEIEAVIRGSSLSETVKASSMAMFTKIARAEAKVHGMPLEEVHFHEVGAVDSIVDMVGAAIALDYLKVDRVLSSPVQVGGGMVKCAHGLIPVPGPATTEILRGIPLRFGVVPFETTTPTGAAILAANVDEFTEKADFTILSTGYGLGSRELDIPNVLRVFLGTMRDAEAGGNDYKSGTFSGLETSSAQSIIETNIDDMNPELYNYVEEMLFEAGALDVFKTPIIMKKGRPAVKLSILTDSTAEDRILDILFKETTSIGIRKFPVGKMMLPRSVRTVRTVYGEAAVKITTCPDGFIKWKAEYEDCKKLAKAAKVPISDIYTEVALEMAKTKNAK